MEKSITNTIQTNDLAIQHGYSTFCSIVVYHLYTHTYKYIYICIKYRYIFTKSQPIQSRCERYLKIFHQLIEVGIKTLNFSLI